LTCPGGRSHVFSAIARCSGESQCTVSGRCRHGERCSIPINNLILFAGEEDRSEIFSRVAVARTLALVLGFCHAHSNCSAWTSLRNPCTTTSISHGRSFLVFFAPALSAPLCCRILRGGFTVNPT
jgi:hypothetical protein